MNCGGKLPGYRKIVGENYRDTGKLWGKITGIQENCGGKVDGLLGNCGGGKLMGHWNIVGKI